MSPATILSCEWCGSGFASARANRRYCCHSHRRKAAKVRERGCVQASSLCVDCGCEIPRVTPRGPLPMRCSACKEKHRSRRHGRPNYCVDCGEVIPPAKGKPAKRCPSCRAAHATKPLHHGICPECGVEHTSRRPRTYCGTECRESANRRRWKADPARAEADRVRARKASRASRDNAKAKRAVIYEEWAFGGCRVCGVSAPGIIAAHHVNPSEKEYSVAATKGVKRLRYELAKCVPLCLNHHQLVHQAMRNGGEGLGIAELIRYVREQYPETIPREKQAIGGLYA